MDGIPAGIAKMLDLAGSTIGELQALLAESERVRFEQEETIEHLRSELRDR